MLKAIFYAPLATLSVSCLIYLDIRFQVDSDFPELDNRGSGGAIDWAKKLPPTAWVFEAYTFVSPCAPLRSLDMDSCTYITYIISLSTS